MTTTRGAVMLAGLLVLLAGAGTARADGMGFVVKTSTSATGEIGKAVPTTQRAALVRDGASWSLILEPKYDRPKAGAAWLVPFAHCPTVSAADPKVLAELGLVTAPLFLEVCVQTCRCEEHSSNCLPVPFGGGSTSGKDFGDGSGSTTAATKGKQPLDVDVWQTGTIGTLDFAVISADDPADIPKWLDQGGYDNPPALAEFVTSHAADYGCYFAAKLGAPADEHDVFPAVRFALDPRDPPSYPLRLTRLGVAEGATLGVTLFVVNPADRGADGTTTNVVLDGFDAAVPACDATTPGGFQGCVDRALAASPSALAVTFHDGLGSRRASFLGTRRLCRISGYDTYWDYGYSGSDTEWCIGTDDVLAGIPAVFTPDVEGWLAGEARVTRYEARLPASALARDLVFRVGPGAPARACESDDDCHPSADWEWDGTTCLPSGAGGACARYCEDASDCPRGWTCEAVDDYRMVCVPPAGAAASAGASVPDPLPATDGLHVAITSGCGFDCDEMCGGGAASTSPDFGSPGPTRAIPRTVVALVLLAAAYLALAGGMRRRGGRPCAS